MIRKASDFNQIVGRVSISGNKKIINHDQIEIEFSESKHFEESMGMDDNPLDDDSN